MKYKEITVYAKDSAQLFELTERLTAEGMEELMINDPSDVDELIEGSWAYTGSVADRELLDSFREKAWAKTRAPMKSFSPCLRITTGSRP